MSYLISASAESFLLHFTMFNGFCTLSNPFISIHDIVQRSEFCSLLYIIYINFAKSSIVHTVCI
jgi:hypothetical protein